MKASRRKGPQTVWRLNKMKILSILGRILRNRSVLGRLSHNGYRKYIIFIIEKGGITI